MKITILLNAQVKSAAETDKLIVELESDARFNELMNRIKSLSINKLNDILFNKDQQLSRTLLFILNLNQQIKAIDNIKLNEGDTISILSPISGG